MDFIVTEIKKLGRGFEMSVSVRLEAVPDPREAQCNTDDAPPRYTIHAVLPFEAFKTIQISQLCTFQHGTRQIFQYDLNSTVGNATTPSK